MFLALSSNLQTHREIMKGNVSAALLDVGVVLSTALVIWSAMRWVDSEVLVGLELYT